MSDFVFLNLPENYRLADALADGKQFLWWRTTRLNNRIAAGDRVFIWQGRGNAPGLRGIHAVAEVVDRPRRLQQSEFDDYWQNDDEKAVADEHTRLRVLERAPRGRQLQQALIVDSPILRDRGVFTGAMGVNFTLTKPEADELYRLWRQHVPVQDSEQTREDAIRPADPEGKFDETARHVLENASGLLANKSLAELRELIGKPGRLRENLAKPVMVAGRPRDPAIVAYAKVRAGHKCEVSGCEMLLFLTSAGRPFVEVHHIRPLSEGGTDTIQNVACVCPSHHREAHHGADAALIEGRLRTLRERD
jgi:hypothetical protein